MRRGRKYIFILLVMMLLLTGCKADTEGISIQKMSDESQVENFTEEFGNDVIDKTSKQCEKVASECLKYVNDLQLSDEDKMKRILSYFKERDSSAVDFQNQYDMTQYEKVENFCIDAKNNKDAEITFYRVHQDYSIEQYYIYSRDGVLYLKRSLISWNADTFDITELATYVIEEWNYTDKGYFIMNNSHSQGYDGATLDDAIRVLPLDSTLREWNRLYILPIGYDNINLFLIDWDASTMDKIDYLDLYPAFYQMKYCEKMPGQTDGVLIPQEQYESLMKEYLPVDSLTLQKEFCFRKQKGGYIWKNREFIESAPGECPIPEVEERTQIRPGIWELTIDAVWARKETDKAFRHVVTIEIQKDNEVRYISNKLLSSQNDQMPVYEERIY